MKAVGFAQLSREDWNSVCDASEEAWVYHRHEWVEIEADNGVEANHSFGLVGDDGALVGVQPLYSRSVGLGRWIERLLDSGVHRHTGLALRAGLGPNDRKAARSTAMSRILVLAEEIDADRIQLNCQNLAPRSLSADREEVPFWVLDHGFQLGLHFGPMGMVPVPGMATCCADQIVVLRGVGEGDLFRGLDESCRRAVRKAEKSGLRAVLGEDEESIDDYYDLARVSAQRTGEALPPLEYFRSIFRALHSAGRCRLLFAVQDERKGGALFLLADKDSVAFMAGVSHHDFLPMRVNDFMHWSAVRWARDSGYSFYRLGPIFPELPPDWAVSKVTRFKSKFGGRSVPIVQGSLFRRPERYLADGMRQLKDRCCSVAVASRGPAAVAALSRAPASPRIDRDGLGMVLRPYGLMDLFDSALLGGALSADADGVRFVVDKQDVAELGVQVHQETRRRLYYSPRGRRWPFGSRRPVYHALLPHRTFVGPDLEPVWADAEGRAVIAWHRGLSRRTLLVGLDVTEEIVRHRQGDPSRVETATQKGGLGFAYERPEYLFQEQLVPGCTSEPWADHLGYFLAESLSRLNQWPIVEPLPGGARGAVILTGDDDQAFLEKYAEQLAAIGTLPMTYFLHPMTRHNRQTVEQLPPRVELGLHPDALDRPEDYDHLCLEQAKQIEELSGRKMRLVRNHSYLNRGYLGHLGAWERCGLKLDANYAGSDGTVLTGSLLPMRARHPDGRWSNHYSLLTLFGDGMIFALKMSEREAAKRIRRAATSVESSGPGVVLVNLHPQNIDVTRGLHREVRSVAARPGWIALGLDSYLDWIETLEQLRVEPLGNGRFLFRSSREVRDLVARWPNDRGWRRQPLAPWSGEIEVRAE